ncbi:MAG: hypothetical protein DRQ47_09925 [Gammaproteobacteria bacterium]|nr:MAG: hypothetical protein DRQ47_09925 [Gammaproteobacteria bacterium]
MNRKAKIFNFKQLVVLLFGITGDVIGTMMMKSLATEVNYDFHTISGYLGLTLMLLMGAVGLNAVSQKNQSMLEDFGKYFTPILLLWLTSYVTGIIVGLQKVY